jgi:hypothetical protein
MSFVIKIKRFRPLRFPTVEAVFAAVKAAIPDIAVLELFSADQIGSGGGIHATDVLIVAERTDAQLGADRPRAPHHRLIVTTRWGHLRSSTNNREQIVITPEQQEQIQMWLDAADSGAYGAVDGVYEAAHLIKALVAEVRELETRLADRTGPPATPSKQCKAATS